MSTREALHRLIDELPEDQAERLLARILDPAPVAGPGAPTDEPQARATEAPTNGTVSLTIADALVDDEALIEKHIGLEQELRGARADAYVKRTGVPIWALVTYLGVYDGDAARVASDFELSREEMDAALAFYRRNRKYVDARVLLNEA